MLSGNKHWRERRKNERVTDHLCFLSCQCWHITESSFMQIYNSDYHKKSCQIIRPGKYTVFSINSNLLIHNNCYNFLSLYESLKERIIYFLMLFLLNFHFYSSFASVYVRSKFFLSVFNLIGYATKHFVLFLSSLCGSKMKVKWDAQVFLSSVIIYFRHFEDIILSWIYKHFNWIICLKFISLCWHNHNKSERV